MAARLPHFGGHAVAGATSGPLRQQAGARKLRRIENDPAPILLSSTDDTRAVVRHLAATLAYRAAKILREVPPEFSSATFESASRQPVQILAHLADLMAWAVTLARGEYIWKPAGGDDWHAEVTRFFEGLSALDAALAAGAPPAGAIERLLQGTIGRIKRRTLGESQRNIRYQTLAETRCGLAWPSSLLPIVARIGCLLNQTATGSDDRNY